MKKVGKTVGKYSAFLRKKSPEKVNGLRGHHVLLRCHQQEENGGAAQLLGLCVYLSVVSQ